MHPQDPSPSKVPQWVMPGAAQILIHLGKPLLGANHEWEMQCGGPFTMGTQ